MRKTESTLCRTMKYMKPGKSTRETMKTYSILMYVYGTTDSAIFRNMYNSTKNFLSIIVKYQILNLLLNGQAPITNLRKTESTLCRTMKYMKPGKSTRKTTRIYSQIGVKKNKHNLVKIHIVLFYHQKNMYKK